MIALQSHVSFNFSILYRSCKSSYKLIVRINIYQIQQYFGYIHYLTSYMSSGHESLQFSLNFGKTSLKNSRKRKTYSEIVINNDIDAC